MKPSFDDFRDNFYKNITVEEMERVNAESIKQTEIDYKEFKTKLSLWYCSLCKDRLTNFNRSNPCLHWLLRPKWVKKKDIANLFNSGIGYFRSCAYLKWLANIEAPISNINNLKEEMSENKKIELTIRYKNIQWAFVSALSDFSWHLSTNQGTLPHFHFEMKIDGNNFICFNDIHAPFTEEDLFNFWALENGKMKAYEANGIWIQELLDEIPAKDLLESLKTKDDPKKEAFHLGTILFSPPLKTKSWNKIIELIKENKETNIPFAKLIEKLDVGAITVISPGDGLPKLSKRTPRKRK